MQQVIGEVVKDLYSRKQKEGKQYVVDPFTSVCERHSAHPMLPELIKHHESKNTDAEAQIMSKILHYARKFLNKNFYLEPTVVLYKT